MGGNGVKFLLLICTADRSSTAQPPTAFSTARAHTGPSSACLQKGAVVLLCSAPLMVSSWKKSYLYSVAEDKSLQSLQGHRDWSWEGGLLQAQRLHVLLFCLLWPRRSKHYWKDAFRFWANWAFKPLILLPAMSQKISVFWTLLPVWDTDISSSILSGNVFPPEFTGTFPAQLGLLSAPSQMEISWPY